MVNAYAKGQEHPHEQPEFVAYSHLRIRTKVSQGLGGRGERRKHFLALFACRNFPGVTETTLCSTTLTPTLFPMATRAPITEGLQRRPAAPVGGA